MAASYEKLGDLDNALEHYHKALIGREMQLGADNPRTLSSVVAVSSIYNARGDTNTACDLLLRAIKGFEKRCGEDHITTLSAKYKLAEVYRGKSMLQMSLKLHQEVLDRKRATLGPNLAPTLNSEHTIGIIYQQMKQHNVTILHLRRALEGREQSLSRVHSLTTSIALDLASAHFDSDQPVEAIKYYNQALEGIQYRNPGSRTAGLVTTANIALCYSGSRTILRLSHCTDKF
ncbi:uncharacterized protein PV07_06370 [Cladophialophora immunda]|uniref:Uncharacterized protein n=1 Tax=Cladophialophora immunda TaxID=569365 RepID=A0A0D2AZB2_9EURO|nr:uncharacterized protein PV07_06370 [Cladophialophora immunda]KIW30642.1 hypothetical protein PV07_06370 [Cladophialophora immunda]